MTAQRDLSARPQPPTRPLVPTIPVPIQMATYPDMANTGQPIPAFGDVLVPPPLTSPTPDWGSDPVLLKDFAQKRQVPGFAKIVKGSYMTLGSSKFSLSKQHQEVFVHSVKMSVKVLAHCLKRVEATSVTRRGSHNVYTTTRLYAVDQRLAVPISYQGWFELLSEDGQSARPITSVHELSKVKPVKVLVRENMKCYVVKEDSKLTFDKTKIVLAGEQLTLNGEISLPSATEGKKVKLLRCKDSNNEFVYLSFDQKGTFTPIAGENDFTGVFTIRDVVRRFRLPLTVKLVQGVRPKVDTSRFTGLVRLDWVYTDETAFVCPIEKNHVRLLPVPTDVTLQLSAATNQQAMKTTELYRTMMTKCSRMVSNYNNTLHLIVQVPNAAAKGKDRASNANVFSIPFESESGAIKSHRSRARENRLMDEIDDLYGYVREGGPPPSNVKFSYDSDEESYWEEPAYEPLDDFRARLRALEAGERVSYHSKYQPQDPSKLNLDFDPMSSAAALRRLSMDSVNGVMTSAQTNKADGLNSHANVLQGEVVPAVAQSPLKSPPPPLPPRPPDLVPGAQVTTVSTQDSNSKHRQTPSRQSSKAGNGSGSGSGSGTPPPIPPRRYSREDSAVTTVSNLGMVSSSQVSLVSPHLMDDANPQSPTSRPPAGRRISSGSAGSQHSGGKQTGLLYSKSAGSQDSNSNSGGSSGGNGRHRNHIARDFKDSDISSVTRAGSSGGSSGPQRTSNVRKKLQTLYL